MGSAYELELRLRKGDGSYRRFLARCNPVRDDKGQITRWYVACTDIDESSRMHCAQAAGAYSGPQERRHDSGFRDRRLNREFARSRLTRDVFARYRASRNASAVQFLTIVEISSLLAIRLEPSVGLFFSDRLTLSGLGFFWRESSNDGLYGIPGNLIRAQQSREVAIRRQSSLRAAGLADDSSSLNSR